MLHLDRPKLVIQTRDAKFQITDANYSIIKLSYKRPFTFLTRYFHSRLLPICRMWERVKEILYIVSYKFQYSATAIF